MRLLPGDLHGTLATAITEETMMESRPLSHIEYVRRSRQSYSRPISRVPARADEAAQDATPMAGQARITSEAWGEADGEEVPLYTLTNANGMEVKITNYGGIITSSSCPTATATWTT